MSNIDVSVVITNYNYGRFVADAVESVLDQGPGVEIIVVDDGSTDDSIAVLQRFGDQIRVLTKPNGGQGSAFNLGIGATTGQLIMLLDADDMLLPGAVSRVRAAAAVNPDAVMLLHPLQVVDGDGRPTGATLPEVGRRLPNGDMRARMLAQPDDIGWQPTSGLTFPADSLDRVLPVPEEPFIVCADVYLVNTVPLHGPVVALDEPGARYRDHGQNAHLRSGFDVERARATITRSELTHEEIRRRSAALGLRPADQPPRLRSVTDHASRLLVARMDRSGLRPAFSQARLGVEAALQRPDVGWTRKGAMVGWFAAAAITPRSLLPTVASLALTR